jgi:starch phosphorylase
MIMENEQLKSSQIYGLLPLDIEGVNDLVTLALDLRMSWKHNTEKIWNKIDPDLWEDTHSPWIVLKTASRDKLSWLLSDSYFREQLNELIHIRNQEISKTSWFEKTNGNSALTSVAYFSMEYMLSEALPIYVGGLGNVAGDQLKSASDLGVPVVAVGLLYQQGYFRQRIDPDGKQLAYFPFNDPGQLPIMPVRGADGEWVRVQISLAGHQVWLRSWQVQVGRVKLLLLDSNDSANLPEHRTITGEVYGGGPEIRIQQEIILGIGGWKLLNALNIHPEVCHMNEGHAAFLILQRAADFMHEYKTSFEEALTITRAGNLFTTHTAVAAGFDHFDNSLMWNFFGDYAKQVLHIDFDELMSMGRINGNDHNESFNMAWLAIRGSGAVNGVSRLHGEVSRGLFALVFPRWPISEIPVGSVTNGVHMPSWVSDRADQLWLEACGEERWNLDAEKIKEKFLTVEDERFWRLRNESRSLLAKFIHKKSKAAFDPRTLTLGFARRFVAYKRPNLLLHDPERFVRILKNQDRPVQLAIAGKVPPTDQNGQELVYAWMQFIRKYELQNNIVFLEDYDMLVAEHLVQGIDLWVNTPRRPWEACGTSGMKILANGGLNLSELDGWWVEAYSPEVGWALGDKQEHGADQAWDAAEATTLYELLENEIVPDFYNRNETGIPLAWVKKMKSSMATLTHVFSANRTVQEYTEKYYLPGAANYKKRSASAGAVGKQKFHELEVFRNHWAGIHPGRVELKETADGHDFSLSVNLNGISLDRMSVELYADTVNGFGPEKIPMSCETNSVNLGSPIFHAHVKSGRPAGNYTVRIIPSDPEISVPLENNLIRWA